MKKKIVTLILVAILAAFATLGIRNGLESKQEQKQAIQDSIRIEKKAINDSIVLLNRLLIQENQRYISVMVALDSISRKGGILPFTYEYASYCESKNDMVENILNSYYSRNDPPRIYKVYKPCKDIPVYIKDTIDKPTFYLGEGMIHVMTPEEYERFEKGIPVKLNVSADYYYENGLYYELDSAGNRTGNVGVGRQDTTSLYTSEYKYGIPEGIKMNTDTSYWEGSRTIDTAKYISADSISSWRLSEPQSVSFGITAPIHDIEIKVGEKSLNIDFKGDSLIVTGDAKLDESAKIFIDFCRKYMKTKIDSLEIELQKYKDLFLNQKVNYIPGEGGGLTEMGNSSIYDDTTKLIRTTDLGIFQSIPEIQVYDTEPIGITNIEFLTFQMLLDYEKECARDTITIVQYEYKSDFLFKQMEDKGYKRFSGHFYGTNPFRYEHYFVKEATLKGFIQWYKTKIK